MVLLELLDKVLVMHGLATHVLYFVLHHIQNCFKQLKVTECAYLVQIFDSFGVSGGCMNPTLSFGPAVVSGMWNNYWIYWVAPILGAIISGTIFRCFNCTLRYFLDIKSCHKSQFNRIRGLVSINLNQRHFCILWIPLIIQWFQGYFWEVKRDCFFVKPSMIHFLEF